MNIKIAEALPGVGPGKRGALPVGKDDVHTLCEALEIPRGTLCNHILRNKRANAQFEKRREEYHLLICEVFAEYRQVLGAEKIWMILARRGASGRRQIWR